jgi:hypothetical protein
VRSTQGQSGVNLGWGQPEIKRVDPGQPRANLGQPETKRGRAGVNLHRRTLMRSLASSLILAHTGEARKLKLPARMRRYSCVSFML